MNKHRHNVTRLILAIGAMAGLQLAGCSGSESPDEPTLQDAEVSPAHTDGATSTLPVVDAGTPADPCIRCPSEFGDCKQPDLSEYPSRSEVIAEWRERCPGALTAGTCTSSGLTYVHFNGGLGQVRRYFDADGTFVGAMMQGDLLDEQCRGKTEWPQHTPCDESTERVDLCANTGPL